MVAERATVIETIPDERLMIGLTISQICARALAVGDLTQRRQVRAGLEQINQLHLADKLTLGDKLVEIEKLILGPTVLLLKLYAVMTAVDWLYAENNPTLAKLFADAFKKDLKELGQPGDRELLAGMFFARHCYCNSDHTNWLGQVAGLQGKIEGIIRSEGEQQFVWGMLTAARVVASSWGGLTVRFPEYWIRRGAGQEKVYLTGVKVPDSVRALPVTRLPTPKKLAEAVKSGMPVAEGITEQRLPHLMVGWQTENPQRIWEGRKGIFDGSRFVHLYCPVLDCIKEGGNRCGFDMLSYWVAVRVSRELAKGETLKGFDVSFNKWVRLLVRKHDGSNVFDLARTESGVSVSDDALTEYLRESVKNLVYQDRRYTSPIREPNQIAQLYFDHFWVEMPDQDKIDLALILWMDGNCAIKDKVVPSYRITIDDVVKGTSPMTDGLEWLLLNLINCYGSDYAKVRMETIFDKTIDGGDEEDD